VPRPLRLVAVGAAAALAAATLPFAFSSAQAAPDDGAFAPLRGFEATGAKVRVEPRDYTAVKVDTSEVRADLGSAPRSGAASSTEFAVPTPTGGTERFAVQRTSVMQAKLAAAHPEIQTWSGTSLDHPGTTIALDVTPMGFHASVRGPNGQNAWYVDPAYNKPGTTAHLSYYAASLPKESAAPFERELPAIKRDIDKQRASASKADGGLVTQRVYRLALLSDPTYAKYFKGADNVAAEKATLVNRVNQIYNDDLGVKMVLVDGNDALNLATQAEATGVNGPCAPHRCFQTGTLASCYGATNSTNFVATLQRTQIVIGQLIGASNYDIGHLALGTNGGGIANLGAVGSIEKAQGCTGIPTPEGDAYAVDYVAHEMGHQFGGNHTFNGNQYNCSSSNREPTTSVEPGSGSSVMAYAGICHQDDLQPHSDPYFSQRSIDEIGSYTSHPAARPVEVQDISLTGFDTDGESITIGYPSSSETFTLVRGGTGDTAYNTANVEAAVEALTGKDVTVSQWGYDPYATAFDEGGAYPAVPKSVNDTGFDVTFDDDLDPYGDNDAPNGAPENMADLDISGSTGVGVDVAESSKGGPADNEGTDGTHETTNHAPVVRAPANKTIPMRTPFTLTGSGTDADGNKLTYLWEQNDVGGRSINGGTALVANNKRNGPLFRVFGLRANVTKSGSLKSPSPGENKAGRSPSRTFPDLAQVLAGNTNARTGKCPKAPANPNTAVPVRTVNCFSEFLPVKGYVGTAGSAIPAMHFRLTARDGVAGGGGVGHDDVTLRLASNAGPFLVSSLNGKHDVVERGKRSVIRWAVNRTTRLAPKVRILLSTNGGKTWTRRLATTANDGRVTVTFPRVKARNARIKIEAVGNYFFDVNDHPFRIR
jgi:hypothetical protein